MNGRLNENEKERRSERGKGVFKVNFNILNIFHRKYNRMLVSCFWP